MELLVLLVMQRNRNSVYASILQYTQERNGKGLVKILLISEISLLYGVSRTDTKSVNSRDIVHFVVSGSIIILRQGDRSCETKVPT